VKEGERAGVNEWVPVGVIDGGDCVGDGEARERVMLYVRLNEWVAVRMNVPVWVGLWLGLGVPVGLWVTVPFEGVQEGDVTVYVGLVVGVSV